VIAPTAIIATNCPRTQPRSDDAVSARTSSPRLGKPVEPHYHAPCIEPWGEREEQAEENDDKNVGDNTKRGGRRRQGAPRRDPVEDLFLIGEKRQHRSSDRRLCDEPLGAFGELREPRPQLVELTDELRPEYEPRTRQEDQKEKDHNGNGRARAERRPPRKGKGKVADGYGQKGGRENQEQNAP
jgi:hypothetical protein